MRDFDEAIDRLIAGLEKKRVMNASERADRRLPRVGPRDRRHGAARPGSGAQDFDRAARLRRARLHDAAAARGSLPDDAHRSAQPARGAARRPHRRRDRARRDLDRRAERPAARHRHRPRDGHGVGHERARSAPSTTPATSAPRSSTSGCRRSAALYAESTAQQIDARGQAHHDRSARHGAPDPQRAPRQRSSRSRSACSRRK